MIHVEEHDFFWESVLASAADGLKLCEYYCRVGPIAAYHKRFATPPISYYYIFSKRFEVTMNKVEISQDSYVDGQPCPHLRVIR